MLVREELQRSHSCQALKVGWGALCISPADHKADMGRTANTMLTAAVVVAQFCIC